MKTQFYMDGQMWRSCSQQQGVVEVRSERDGYILRAVEKFAPVTFKQVTQLLRKARGEEETRKRT